MAIDNSDRRDAFVEEYVRIRQEHLENGLFPIYMKVCWDHFEAAKQHDVIPEENYVGGYNSDLLGVIIEPFDISQLDGIIEVEKYVCRSCAQEMLNCKKGKFCPVCGTKDF